MITKPEQDPAYQAAADVAPPQVIEVIVESLEIDLGRRPALASALARLAIQHKGMAHILNNPLTGKQRKARLARLIKNLGQAQELLRGLLLGTRFG